MLVNLLVMLYLALPITLLASSSLPSGVFYALIGTSLALLAQKRFAGAVAQIQRYRWLLAGYCMLFCVIAASSWYHGEWAGANSEGALRLIVGLGILLLVLPHVDIRRMQGIMVGIYIAGVISTATVFWLSVNTDSRPLTSTIIIVSYSSIVLLIGAITVYSLRWQLTTWPKLEFSLKILLACTTAAGFLVAQTRTGLLGLPVFLVLGCMLFIDRAKPSRALILLLVSGILAIVAVANDHALHDRIAQGIQEVQACKGENSTQYSSMCIRLQMWRTAIDGGMSHPWVGLGNGNKFNQYMQDVGVPKGLVGQAVVDAPFGEPHNDLLLMFFGFGFPGALGLLLIYLMPCAYFLPRLLNKEIPPHAKAAAAMGLAVCLGFFFFGMTETMFRRMNTIGFYTAMVAWFMVLSETRVLPQSMPAPTAAP